MGFFYLIGGIALLVLGIMLIVGPRNVYRCQKCGYETFSEVEAAGHEKVENAHKVVQE